jgi:hypothetical protein
LFQTVHEHPVVGGLVSRIPPRVFASYADDSVFGPLLRASESTTQAITPPQPAALRDGLKARGVRYVILRRSAASRALTAWIDGGLGSFLIARDSDHDLFDLGPV